MVFGACDPAGEENADRGGACRETQVPSAWKYHHSPQ
jgi:hypothetical protein